MVGFILMKVSSWNMRVSAPKIPTITAVIMGISGKRLFTANETISAIAVVPISAAVAA